jgi:predicted AlkP superfamily phosphohydrolase/phosphomutase
MGDKITVSGNIQNSNITIKSTLTNVQQSVGAMPTRDETARQELQDLIQELSKALERIPGDRKEQAEAVAASAEALIDNAKAEKPNKTLLQISGEGLKKAAENLAEVAPAVLTIAGQVVAAVMRMRGLV